MSLQELELRPRKGRERPGLDSVFRLRLLAKQTQPLRSRRPPLAPPGLLLCRGVAHGTRQRRTLQAMLRSFGLV